MSAWAVRGAKCVCVVFPPAAKVADDCLHALPVVGEVYTVNDTGISPWGMPVIGLAELDQTVFYETALFRPLISQEDDVRLIKSLLISNPVDAGLVPAGVEFSV